MKLSHFLETSEITLDAFAERIGVANASVVHRYAKGTRIPRPAIMQAITRETNGEVTASDFYAAAA